MHIGQTPLLLNLSGIDPSIVEGCPPEQDFGAIPARRNDLCKWRIFRHHDRRRKNRRQNQRDRDRSREHADRIGECARKHEYDGRKAACGNAEAVLEECVRRHEIATVVTWQQDVCDDDSSDDVSGRDLQKAEIPDVGESGNRYDSQRTGFCCDDREENRPPWDGVVGDEIVARALLVASQVDAEERGSGEVRNEYDKVEGGERIFHSPPPLPHRTPVMPRRMIRSRSRPSRSGS